VTDSHTETLRTLRHWLLALILGLPLGVSCAQTAPPLGDPILLPMQRSVGWLPEPTDKAAATAAAAALANKPKLLEEQVVIIRETQDSHKGEDLEILSQDLVHSTLDDPRAYREASTKLTKGYGTDHAVQARLDQVIGDDPLDLARQRRWDTWETYWARTFNAIAKTVGQSVTSGFVLAPVQLATTTGHYLASFSNDEPLSTSGRQELALHKEYLARHGDADNAEDIQERVDKNQKRLVSTMHKRRLRAARYARNSGRHRAAILESKRALAWGHHEDAVEIKQVSQQKLQEQLRLLGQSLKAADQDGFNHGDEWDVNLATELLLTSSRKEPLSEDTLEVLKKHAYQDGPRNGESLYIYAMAQKEAGFEDRSWATLQHLSKQGHGETPMARHANHSLNDAWQNPYRAYRSMISERNNEKWKWRILGGYANGSKYPNLPSPVAYTLEGPGIASTVATSPVRMIFANLGKEPDFQRPAAVLGYRYLELNPRGTHSREVMMWLFEYEQGRGNHAAALRLADFIPGTDPEKRNALAEAASNQALTAANRSKRSDYRTHILRQTSTEYPDTQAGVIAGKEVRLALVHSSPQKIRMTRDFLKQNPRVSGDTGLGLNPNMINGELEDGELHPSGVSLLGGRRLQFNMIQHDKTGDDPPAIVKKQVSQERMAKLASSLEETTHRNQLLDHDDLLDSDADRDHFLERARVGLTEQKDHRPSAQSTYVYKSMRERYGLVRGRDSILPFDLVVQGNFQDLGLGAFPRWREPEQTPDAFLYR
jgi:hypothetical protein